MIKNTIISTLIFLSFLACKTQSKTPENNTAIIPGEVIIDLKKDIETEVIITTFSKYGLAELKSLSPDMNIALYRFDTDKISLEKIIKKLNKNENVESAQTNKKTNYRR